jgi:predicted transcriptional regulator
MISIDIQLNEKTTEPAFVAGVERGLAAADAGRTVPYEMVRRWLSSWGDEEELPPPECP